MIEWDLLKQLSQERAISGRESSIMSIVSNYLHTSAHIDGLGSHLFQTGKNGVSIMIATHADEVGFVVSSIDDNGFIYLQSVGNMWTHTLISQLVTIHTKQKNIQGIIAGPAVHSLPIDKRKEVIPLNQLFVDIGVSSKDEALQLGIEVGDMVSVVSEFTPLQNANYLMCKALDNRVGVFIGASVFHTLKQQTIDNKLTLALTVQEEVGLRGARTSAYTIFPDIAIAVDTMVAGDTPLDKNNIKLGKGVGINVIDSMTITHRGLLVYLEQLCQKHNIPYQLSCCTDGGTDAGNIHKTLSGILTTTLSIPIRYMHTHQSIIHKDDVIAAYHLLLAIVEDLTVEKLEKIMTENYLYKEE